MENLSMNLTDSHKVEITYQDGDFFCCITPTVGRELYLNLWWEGGCYEFTVAHSSGYYNDAFYIDSWIKYSCDQFEFNGKTYGSIYDVTMAMLDFELRQCANDEARVEDVLECIEEFAEQIQKELYG